MSWIGSNEVQDADRTKAALASFQNYHQEITRKNLRTAYDYYDIARKNSISYEGWESGYRDTISSTVTNVRVTYIDANQAKISYELNARDRANGRVKVLLFNGSVTMIKENGRWLIHDIESDKLKEFYE